jgi:hypothetical protein
LLTEQATHFDHMRDVAYDTWLEMGKRHNELVDEGRPDAAIEMASKAIGASDAISKAQVRSERIRSMLKAWRESLYLTPRARAGVAPASKEKEPEVVDPMEALLGQVTSYVNGDQKDEE